MEDFIMENFKKIIIVTIIITGVIIFFIVINRLHFDVIINKKTDTENIIIESNNKIIQIIDYSDIIKIKSILKSLKYDLGICKGERSYKVICDNEIYYIKEGCKEIENNGKQSKISQNDLNILIKIINKN